jgi:hypothetical protein
MKRIIVGLIMLAVLSGAHCAKFRGQYKLFEAELEGGAVFSGYNDFKVPNPGGTALSLVDDLKSDVAPFARLRVTCNLNAKHLVSVLAAPLRIDASGTLGYPVTFEGTTFAANTPLDCKYKFDSYRITYRYTYYECRSFKYGIGITAKVRDASIGLSGGGASSKKTNLGFVPLVNFYMEQKLKIGGMFVEGDALIAPVGRAEDIFAGVHIDFSKNLSMKVGYRMLEGGADVASVYSFAMFHYLAVGVTGKF